MTNSCLFDRALWLPIGPKNSSAKIAQRNRLTRFDQKIHRRIADTRLPLSCNSAVKNIFSAVLKLGLGIKIN